MRQVGYGLHDLFVAQAAHFIEADGEEDGHGKTAHGFHDADDQGIFEGQHKTVIHQDLFEILQPHKGARPDVVKTDIDKCKPQSNHGDVVKDEYEQQAGNEHEQKCAVLFDPLNQVAAAAVPVNANLCHFDSPYNDL